MSELTKVERCPNCNSDDPNVRLWGYGSPVDTWHEHELGCALAPACEPCDHFWHSSPVPEGPATIQAQSMSDYRRITLAGKDALPPAQPSPVVQTPIKAESKSEFRRMSLQGAPVVPVEETKRSSRRFMYEYERRFRKNRKRPMQWADIAEMMDEFAALSATEKEN